jgi:hypothetical protein
MKPDITPELMDWLKGAAEKSADFVEQQAPLYASELVAWHYSSSLAWGCVFMLMGILAVAGVVVAIIGALRSNDSDLEVAVPLGMLMSLAACFFVFLAAGNFCEAIKAKVAPRVVLVDSLKRVAN